MAKREKKKGKIKYIIPFVIIIVAIIAFISIRQSRTEVSSKEESLIQEISKEIENNSLESNLLNPEELNNEILSKFTELNNIYVVKIQYKLKTLDDGFIYLYYKINDTDLMKVNVSIAEKKINNVEKYNDDTVLSKDKIVKNLKENVEEDFESKKDKLDSESKSVNVIITNTEIVINTSVD